MRILGILFLGMVAAVCMAVLLLLKEPPQRVAADVSIPRSTSAGVLATVRSGGVVAPKVQVEIAPEVPGRIVYVHSQLHAGGVIGANQKILQIDPSRYELALRRARAVVDEAQARLDLLSVAAGARQEQNRPYEPEAWMDLPPVLREPQIRQAEAALEAARAELATAELELERTSVVLPFEVLVMKESANLGQYVNAGHTVAVACGTEAFEIEAPIRNEDLERLDALRDVAFPGRDGQPNRVPAEVRAAWTGVEHVWQGEVVRGIGRVDEASGTMGVIVEVASPLDVSAGRSPLLAGMSVEVVIGGSRKAGALQEGERE